MGQSREEQERLIAQSGLFASTTRRLLVAAGIAPGMRVLDIGCGVGDVALLVAEIVGPTGAVVGVDLDPSAIARAQERAVALGLDNLAFFAGDFRTLDPGGQFDAAVGRLVLMYQQNPAGAIRALLPHLRPGGIVAIQEMESEMVIGLDNSPTYRAFVSWWNALCRRVGIQLHMGPDLYGALVAAGLTDVRVQVEAIAGGGADFPGYRYLEQTARIFLPTLIRFGIAAAEEVDVDTLARRIRDEVVASGGSIVLQLLFGAWGRSPPDAGR